MQRTSKMKFWFCFSLCMVGVICITSGAIRSFDSTNHPVTVSLIGYSINYPAPDHYKISPTRDGIDFWDGDTYHGFVSATHIDSDSEMNSEEYIVHAYATMADSHRNAKHVTDNHECVINQLSKFSTHITLACNYKNDDSFVLHVSVPVKHEQFIINQL